MVFEMGDFRHVLDGFRDLKGISRPERTPDGRGVELNECREPKRRRNALGHDITYNPGFCLFLSHCELLRSFGSACVVGKQTRGMEADSDGLEESHTDGIPGRVGT